MVFAGFDTSSRTAQNTLYHLRKNPECLKQLVQLLKDELDVESDG